LAVMLAGVETTASWPPASDTERTEASDRVLRMVSDKLSRKRSPTYLVGLMSAGRQVCLRAGWDPVRRSVAWVDARDRLLRLQPGRRLRQAVPARLKDAKRLFRHNRGGMGLFAIVLFCSLARVSDWSRKGLLGGPGVTRSDVVRVGAGWQVCYRATKTDPTGTSRRIVFYLPRRADENLAALLRRKPDGALFPYSAADLREFLRKARDRGIVSARLTAHSFRRGGIRRVMRRGAAGRAVVRLTGHQSLEMLSRYAGIVPAEWQRAFEAVGTALHGATKTKRRRPTG
jgi:hypothetical protein